MSSAPPPNPGSIYPAPQQGQPTGAQAQQPYGAYPPPPGAPPGAPGGTYSPYPPPPIGQYTPPVPGQIPYYPSTPGSYPPPAPPGGYAATPYGAYPPPGGYYPPPPAGSPYAFPQAPAPAPAPPPGGGFYAPAPTSMPPLPGGQYPPPAGPYPGAGYAPQPGYPVSQGAYAQGPLIYLGTAIPDPHAPPAAHGVQKLPGYDPAHDFNAVMRATKGGVSDEKLMISTITTLNPFQLDALNDFFMSRHGTPLVEKLDKVTNGNFGNTIHGLALGPLWYDVELAHKALVGLGTNEILLTELILGRPAHEIRLLKTAYKMKYRKELVDEVKGDLSGKTEKLFVMALNAQKPADAMPNSYSYAPGVGNEAEKVNADVEALHHASKTRDDNVFCEILVNRSDGHLGAVINAFGVKYKSLSKVVKKTFSGTMEESLLYIIHGVKPKRDGQGYWRDAKLLEKSMAGLGTKDFQLIYRLVRAHWDPRRMEGIKTAYKNKYKGKTLESRVKGETSGWYKDLLVELIKSSEIKTY